MMDADAITTSIKKLLPSPSLASQAIEALDGRDASLDQIISVVEYDQAITANVLKLCNSSEYGLTRGVRSLREGWGLLGNARFKDIISASTTAKCSEEERKGYDLATEELGKHAVATGIMSRIISHRVRGAEHPSLFTAALLHDIGKVVLDICVDRYFEQIMDLVSSGDHSFLEAESEMLGINHAELGAMIAEWWNFPEDIVRAIRLHHRYAEASADDEITSIIFLADVMALSVGIGWLGRVGLCDHGKEEVMTRYGLKAEDLPGMLDDFYDQYDAVQNTLRFV